MAVAFCAGVVALEARLDAASFAPADGAVEETAKEMETMTLKIDGMTCAHCENTITKALIACPGVASAKVSAPDGTAVVKGENLDKKALAKAVDEAGYSVTDVEK